MQIVTACQVLKLHFSDTTRIGPASQSEHADDVQRSYNQKARYPPIQRKCSFHKFCGISEL